MQIQAGDTVELIEEPQLYFGIPNWLKVGHRYQVKYTNCGCVCVSNPSDPKGIGCEFSQSRVRKVE